MREYISLPEIEEAGTYILSQIETPPAFGLILGSGLSSLADQVIDPTILPPTNIPNWLTSTAPGHAGDLVFGTLGGKPVMVMRGRHHYYEGHSMAAISLPVRVMQRLGIHTLLLTNAAGGINLNFSPGDLMIISDHIALSALVGINPLRGPNLDMFGERFIDMVDIYDKHLISLAERVCLEQQIAFHKGVYAYAAGPLYQTRAETRFIKLMGADAIGMSSVPEAIAAHHGAMRVFGVSGITNREDPDSSHVITHEEVLEAGRLMTPRLTDLITAMLLQL